MSIITTAECIAGLKATVFQLVALPQSKSRDIEIAACKSQLANLEEQLRKSQGKGNS